MTIKELKDRIANVPDNAEVMINVEGTTCKPAKIFAEMVIAPSGSNSVVSGFALVVDVDGEELKIEGKNLTYQLDTSKNMLMRNPDGRIADIS